MKDIKKQILDLTLKGQIEEATRLSELLLTQGKEKEKTSSQEQSETTSSNDKSTNGQDTSNNKSESSNEKVEEENSSSTSSQKQETTTNDKKTKKEEEKKKKQPSMANFIKPKHYDELVEMVKLNICPLLTGEAGTGKTYACEQVAKDLNIEFYYSQAITDEYKIFGGKDIHGNFIPTDFYKFCTKGGLFLIDEIDASDSQILVKLNGAIANRYCDFDGIGRIKLHPQCKFIACANTSGNGANIRYIGRNQLDGATLDRFTLLHREYQTDVEKQLVNNNELVEFYDNFRTAVQAIGLDFIVSYRGLININNLEQNSKLNLDLILKSCLFKHLEKDDLKTIFDNMKITIDNKYAIKMAKMIK